MTNCILIEVTFPNDSIPLRRTKNTISQAKRRQSDSCQTGPPKSFIESDIFNTCLLQKNKMCFT